MLTFFHIFYGSALVLLVVAFVYLGVTYRILRGKLMSVQDQAQHVIRIDQFHQTHPAAMRLHDRVQRWQLISLIATAAALALPFIWIIFFPNFGSPTGMLSLVGVLALALTIAEWYSLTSMHRLRQIYRQHQLIIKLLPHLHLLSLIYKWTVIIITYEALGLATCYALFYF